MTDTVLELTDVTKDYHGLRPLRIQQLVVSAADRVALLGFDQPSAEVFVNLVTGAMLPDAGDVAMFGRPSASISDSNDWLSIVDRFGIVSERAVLLDQLTVAQNLAMPFTLEIEPPPHEVRIRAAALAIEVGLPEDVWARPVREMNAAGRARVRLGRALAFDPAMLLLEHVSAPLARGDVERFGADVREIVERRRIALVAVTADEAFARLVAPRVLRLEGATGRMQDAARRGWFSGRVG